MFKRLSQLFRRYAAFHGKLEIEGFQLRDIDGNLFGNLDSVRIKDGRLTVEGWVFSNAIGLRSGGFSAKAAPNLIRSDVTSAYNEPDFPTPGFTLQVEHSVGHAVFWVLHEGERYIFAIGSLRKTDIILMRAKLSLPFVRDCLRAAPSVVQWYVKRDVSARARIKSIFGLNITVLATLINRDVFETEHAKAPLIEQAKTTRITIVLPVYNAFGLLPDVLSHVLAHTDVPYDLLIIEDKSSDPQVRPYLKEWHTALPAEQSAHIDVLMNEVNLGFIRSVNRALKLAIERGNHVVLLKSDAFVPKDWASRLLAPMLEDESVATVTPMSNDAEIFNVPIVCQRSDLSQGVAALVDDAARKLSPRAASAIAPTGVGFCMAMNIRYLALEPQLDTIFGRGYGEEVDWCRRAVKHGGKHLGHAGLFVEHRGGTSFGSAEKLKLVLANNSIISKRYAGYDQMVQDFIRDDPLCSARLALGLAWADAQAVQDATGPVTVYFAHSLGGGADHYLEREIEKGLMQCAAVVVVRVGGVHRWIIEIHTSMGIQRGETDETVLLEKRLGLLSLRHGVYSCGVGDRDPVELPDVMYKLADGGGHTLEILMHDFYPVSPSYTLLDGDGIFRGVPSASNDDPAHQTRNSDGSKVTLQDWRSAWGKACAAAKHITVFSENSTYLVRTAYPESAERVRVVPHHILHDVPQIKRGSGNNGTPVIGVLGNIGYQKGARVLEGLSKHLVQDPKASLVVIGNIDPAFSLSGHAQVHGSYAVSDLSVFVEKYGITDWLMPSVWPETFSYAIHEAIATGLPVWSFNLGAQGDAARHAATRTGQGGVIDIDLQSPNFIHMLDTMFNNNNKD